MAYRPAANKAYGQTRRKPQVGAAKLQQLASSSVQPSYASKSVMTANAVQSNISSLALFLAKYLSGKNNVVISPDPNSNGYSVGKRKLVNGQIIYDIHVPHWINYKLPLDDKSKYRVYRSGIWHECLPQGHDVICSDGLKDITRIQAGNYVLGHDGHFHIVTDVKRFYYQGDLVKIRPISTGHDIITTPNHPFYSVKRIQQGQRSYGGKSIHALKQLTIQEQQFQWVASEDLAVSDYLLMPVSNVNVDAAFICISDFVKVPVKNGQITYAKNFGEKISRSNKILVTNSFLKLCGFYAAEGHSEKGICFSFGRHELNYVQEVLLLGKEAFGFEGKVYKYPKKYVVAFHAVYLGRLFKEWFGTQAVNKKIPFWLKNLPSMKLLPFLDAYLKGDGSKLWASKKLHHRRYLQASASTASKTLCFDVFQAMLKIGLVPSISVSKQQGFKKGSLIYILRLSANNLEKFTNALGAQEATGIVSKRSQCFINKGFAWLRIKAIERMPFSGFVYNLEVEGCNSFVTELVAVHNSQHVAETPDQVFTFGTRGEEVKEPLAHDTINILEDRRIEDIGVEKWPGYASERLFTNAYAWTRRMDVGAFWNAYLKMHYDDVNRMYLKDEEYIRERKGHMRHEAFLQRLLVMKIKGWDQLPIGERDLIEHEATMVEHELTKLRKQSPETIYRKLAQLSMQVIKDLELKDYVPEVTHVGESTWDQSFKPHTPTPGESQETRTGIDDYFDQLMTVEVVCSGCGKHYTRKLGVRED